MPGSPHFLFDTSLNLAAVEGGIVVSEVSAAEYLEAKNGRFVLDVPHVRDEKHVPMRGTVPDEWRLV